MSIVNNHIITWFTYTTSASMDPKHSILMRLTCSSFKVAKIDSCSICFSQQASQQIDNLQQQLQFVANQRDQAYLQYSALQEQNQMYSSSMANLQMVLEQFQQGEFLQVLSHQENMCVKSAPL